MDAIEIRRRRMSALVLLFALKLKFKSQRRCRRFWVRPSLQEKKSADILHLASLDDEGLAAAEIFQRGYFRAFIRMPLELFQTVLQKVEPYIRRQDTNYRKAISALDRLSITLRFLATGDSYDSLEKLFGVSKSSIGEIIPETCRTIILVLNEFIKTPSTEAEWYAIAESFESRWNFPHCVGAVDGRHCPIIQPQYSGSGFYNYKNFFSIILMAVVDADYKFIYVNVGAQGSVSDGGVFNQCSFKKDLDTGALNLPQAKPLPSGQMPVPYVIVADDAFSLSSYIMKPYPGITDEESPQRAYNYRLSRARRVVENAFGIVSARFRVLRKPMHVQVETASTIVLASCYLHNFIRTKCSEEDHIDASIIAGSHNVRNDEEQPAGFYPLRNQARRTGKYPNDIRNEFCRYFVSAEGQVPWPIPYH